THLFWPGGAKPAGLVAGTPFACPFGTLPPPLTWRIVGAIRSSSGVTRNRPFGSVCFSVDFSTCESSFGRPGNGNTPRRRKPGRAPSVAGSGRRIRPLAAGRRRGRRGRRVVARAAAVAPVAEQLGGLVGVVDGVLQARAGVF